MKILFESHATTVDNEAGIASGWHDAPLSAKGEQEARELGERYADIEINAIFTADLERARRTAELAFPGIDKTFLFLDWRLRECNYGEFEHRPNAVIVEERPERIDKRFPRGESYRQCMDRMGSFIDDLRNQKFETVLIIGSRATHYGLDHHILGKSLDELTRTQFKWQPGWEYEL